jgi:spermidine/putrescine transport system ATP-binding protein
MQRVAIARALAVEPAVLLLDEPLSALDLKLRKHMRAELRNIQQRTQVTFIYITHDQTEALTMSDRVGVMSIGLLEQVAPPEEIYNNPKTAFVATFVGENNRLKGVVTRATGGKAVLKTSLGAISCRSPENLAQRDEAIVFVRPETVLLADAAGDNGTVKCRIHNQSFEGAYLYVNLESQKGEKLVMRLNNNGNAPKIRIGESVNVTFSHGNAFKLPDRDLSDA